MLGLFLNFFIHSIIYSLNHH